MWLKSITDTGGEHIIYTHRWSVLTNCFSVSLKPLYLRLTWYYCNQFCCKLYFKKTSVGSAMVHNVCFKEIMSVNIGICLL